MALIDMLEGAHGGGFFANAGRLAGLEPDAARAAMLALAPAIARGLQRRAQDEAAFDHLLDIIEDGEGDAFLGDAEALTDPEVVADGKAILKDVYGTDRKALKAGRALVPDLADNALRKLMAIAASAVLAALVRANRRQPMVLAATEPEPASGGGMIGAILTAVVEGVVKEAARSLTAKTRRRTYSRRKSRKTPRKQTQRPSLESIFGELLGQMIGGR